MPSINFSLPHWAYWAGLIVFPLVAMALSRRKKPVRASYSISLGYLILLTGGMLGLHRFYLKNLWGLLFIPVFLSILIANGQGQDARSGVSDAANIVRMAERTISRETDRIESAEQSLPRLREELAAAEEGSFARRSIERRIERAEETVTAGRQRLAQAENDLVAARPAEVVARESLAFWQNVARWASYLLLAGIIFDAFILPFLVREANLMLRRDSENEIERSIRVAEEAELEGDARHVSHGWTGWIDRLSLYAGEFVAYWAVIAVFVYYFEVISRYVFNSPTNWAHEAMYLMFGMQYLIAGAYAVLTESHVRVDVFYASISRRRKAWVDLFTSIFFFIFAFTLLFTCYTFAMDAIAVPSGNGLVSDWARGQIDFGKMVSSFDADQWSNPNIRWGEISFNEWEVPLWPMKWVMVVGGLLLVLQGISKFAQDIRAIVEEY